MSNARVVNGPMQVLPVSGVAMRTLSVGATGVAFLTTPLNNNTTHVYWTLESADTRLRLDSTMPTTSIGHIFKLGNSGIWSKSWAENAKVISVSGTAIFYITELNYL